MHAALGPASLVLYDVSTLYFETDQGDGFREPGFSKERRLEPQITIGLLADAAGFLLMVSAFEGNRAETTTILPVITAFMAAHQLPDVTVVADAGMISEANQHAIEDAGLSFILGTRRFLCGYPYLFRVVRDLRCGAAHYSCESGLPQGRSSRWLPTWLPISVGLADRFARRRPGAAPSAHLGLDSRK